MGGVWDGWGEWQAKSRQKLPSGLWLGLEIASLPSCPALVRVTSILLLSLFSGGFIHLPVLSFC